MTVRDAIDIRCVAPEELLDAIKGYKPDQVTVTGFCSGYSAITAVLGDQVYAGTLPVDWVTDVLVVMGESAPTPAAVAQLAELGVPNGYDMVRGLRIGQAILIRRP